MIEIFSGGEYRNFEIFLKILQIFPKDRVRSHLTSTTIAATYSANPSNEKLPN